MASDPTGTQHGRRAAALVRLYLIAAASGSGLIAACALRDPAALLAGLCIGAVLWRALDGASSLRLALASERASPWLFFLLAVVGIGLPWLIAYHLRDSRTAGK